MAIHAFTVADCFLKRANAHGSSISPLKLQKLVFFAHGWYLGFTNKPLISNSINAWKYGPVIPELYHKLKHYEGSPVTEPITDQDCEQALRNADPSLPSLLDEIWRVYGHQSAVQLSALSHEAGSPWDVIAKGRNLDAQKHLLISDETIKTYYSKKVQLLKEKKNARAS